MIKFLTPAAIVAALAWQAPAADDQQLSLHPPPSAEDILELTCSGIAGLQGESSPPGELLPLSGRVHPWS